jgi:hypothetical protein
MTLDFLAQRGKNRYPIQRKETSMKRRTVLAAAVVLAASACAQMGAESESGWTTLIDGEKGLENFTRVGGANWRAEGGAIGADKITETGYLLTKQSYRDFVIRAEFWAENNTNSGIFIRIQTPPKITAKDSYEVNIYDQRAAGLDYGTGGVPNFAKVDPPYPKAANRWNTYVITAKGPVITIELNGRQTAVIRDAKYSNGPFALQAGSHGKEPGGAIKWRKVQVREL